MSFEYNHKLSNNFSSNEVKKSEELADKILDNIFKDEKLFLYLKKWEVANKKWIKIGITNDPSRRDTEQNVLPVPAGPQQKTKSFFLTKLKYSTCFLDLGFINFFPAVKFSESIFSFSSSASFLESLRR